MRGQETVPKHLLHLRAAEVIIPHEGSGEDVPWQSRRLSKTGVIIPHEGSGDAMAQGLDPRPMRVIIPHEGSGVADARSEMRGDWRDHSP